MLGPHDRLVRCLVDKVDPTEASGDDTHVFAEIEKMIFSQRRNGEGNDDFFLSFPLKMAQIIWRNFCTYPP